MLAETDTQSALRLRCKSAASGGRGALLALLPLRGGCLDTLETLLSPTWAERESAGREPAWLCPYFHNESTKESDLLRRAVMAVLLSAWQLEDASTI